MLLIFEGCDRVGKSTFIHEWFGKRKDVRLMHFGRPPQGLTKEQYYAYQRRSFEDVVDYLIDNPQENVVFDRFLYGELIWGPLFRGYEAPYIWDLEKKLVAGRPDTTLVVMVTDNKELMARNDGKGVENDKIAWVQEQYYDIYERATAKKVLFHTGLMTSERMIDHLTAMGAAQ